MHRFRLGVTKIQLRMYGLRFKALTVVKQPSGQEEEVAVFTKGAILGVTTVANTIGVHELAFQSEKVLNYTIVHEAAHKKELHGLLYWSFAVLSPLGLWFALGWIGVPIALMVWFFAVRWLIEFRADCQATRTIGIRAVTEAHEEYLAIFKVSAFIRFVGLSVLHPPLSLTIGVCRLLHKDVH